jgi:hypothetical protein
MKLLSTLAILALPAVAIAQPKSITITGGKTHQANVVIRVPVEGNAGAPNAVTLPDGLHAPAQLAKPGLTDDPAVKQYLVFVLPKLKAGEKVEVTPTMLNYVVAPPHFQFVEKKGEPLDLTFGSVGEKRKVLQYFNLPHDTADHYYTFKPFHHVFDPETGKTQLTSGAYKKATDGLYPHHRGLFFGFNKITYGDKQSADIWHGTDGVFSENDKMLSTEAGEVLGRERSAISWHGKDGKTFAAEEREVTAYATHGGTLIDWNTVLSTKLDKVRLDGDPQHAGFHFRASMDVSAKIDAEKALAKKEKRDPKPADTYYLRPDGKGKLGETRNWEAKTADKRTVDLSWDACSFLVGEKRYTVLRVNHPDNPGEKRGSERDYGRFGDYFEYDLTPDKPLKLKYRVWVQAGEMTVEECDKIAAAFVAPPTVKVAAK